MFRRQWFQIIEPEEVPPLDSPEVKPDKDGKKPPVLDLVMRAWDNAGTEEPTKANEQQSDPDYTASVKMGFSGEERRFYVLDVINQRLSPKGVTDLMYSVMRQDGVEVVQYEEQEGGWSGKGMADIHKARFIGFDYHVVRPMTNKIVRAKPFSSAVEGGIVYLVRAPWNEEFINQLCAFPKANVHDDMVDSAAMAYNQLAKVVGLENYLADRMTNTGEALPEEPQALESVSGGAFGFGNLFAAVRQAQEQRAAGAQGQGAREELDPFGYPVRPNEQSAPDAATNSLASILQMLNRLR
jgi:predicted phage terminase large subunit-like protein